MMDMCVRLYDPMDGAAVDSIAVTLELQKGFVHLPDAVCYMMPYGEQSEGTCIGAFCHHNQTDAHHQHDAHDQCICPCQSHMHLP